MKMHPEGEWIKDYNKTELYMLFLWNCSMIFEEAIRKLEKDGLGAHESFNVMCRLQQNSYSEKQNDSCFWRNKTALKLRKW